MTKRKTITEEKNETTKKMLKEKLDYMIISKVTGKSHMEIKKIKEELLIPNS